MFFVVSAILFCNLMFPSPALTNPPAYRTQQYYFLDKNGGYNYGYQIGGENDEKPFSVSNNEKFITNNNEGSLNYNPQARFLQSKLPTPSNFGENSNVDETSLGYFDNFESQKLGYFGGNVKGRNLYKNPYNNYGDVQSTFNYADGEDTSATPKVIGAKPIGIFVPKQNGAFFVSYTVGDQPNQKGFDRKSPQLSGRKNVEVSTQQYHNEDDETTEVTETTETTETVGDASYRFIIDTDDYKREEESDALGNVKGHFSYKNEAGTHDLSYKAGGNTGFVATGGTLANPYNQTSEEESSTDDTNGGQTYSPNTINIDGYGSPKTPKTESRINKKPKLDRDDSSYGFFINTEDYHKHEIADEDGNVQGYFFYKNDTPKKAISGKPPQTPFLWENFGRKTTKGAKLAPPKPVPYPQSKTAYGVNNYVVRTYLPPQKEKFGYIIVAN